MKQGLTDNGITINLDEDFGERNKAIDGSSIWSEYETSAGTIVLEYLPSSPCVPFFITLHATQRGTGSTGSDTVTVIDRDMKFTYTGSQVAIQSITGHNVKKSKGDSIVVTLNCGQITSIGA